MYKKIIFLFTLLFISFNSIGSVNLRLQGVEYLAFAEEMPEPVGCDWQIVVDTSRNGSVIENGHGGRSIWAGNTYPAGPRTVTVFESPRQ